MMKQFKKALSILCAIALLVSSLTFALAEGPAEQPVVAEPVVAEPVVEEPVVVEPVVVEPVVEEPVVEEPAAEEPVVEEPAAEEPVVEAPVDEEPVVEEPVAEGTTAEELASEEEEVPAEEEAGEEETSAEEEASDDTEDEEDEEDDGLVPLEDNEGYVDQEVIEENTPAITDELKGLRNADLFVGQVLTDYLRFGDELTVTLKGCDASTIELQLYTPVGASINTKVDGKAVGFTPADCDDPSLNLFTYELTNAAGRTHEIVLTSYEDVPFQLAAVVTQVEEAAVLEEVNPVAEENNETPAVEENNETPADVIVDDTTDENIQDEQPEETPAPTIQVSVKTYEALKVGRSISDSLVAGQKAKIQVKCGKHPYVTLTLSVNPDDVIVTIDGDAAQFTAVGNGIYTCDLDDVAFRKFAVVVFAKQDLAFTLSASAHQVEGAPAADEEAEETEEVAENEATEDESEDNIYNEETAEEVTEESAEGIEEVADEAAEETVENNSEEEIAGETVEEVSEEVTEETAEETVEDTEEEAETSEEEGETAEGEEENTEEETEEELAAENAEEESEESAPAYIKVIVIAENGADLYADADKEAEIIGHLEAGEEALVILNEGSTWGQIYSEDEEAAAQFVFMEDVEIAAEEETEEEAEPLTDEQLIELGYRKVQILNQNGTDIYDSTEEEAAVIGHIDFESELWIKDLEEAEGWAEIYTEEGVQQFVKLADIEKQMPTDEEMLEAGYIKVYVAYNIGAKVYDNPFAAKEDEEEEEPVDHLDVGTELWVKLVEGADRALIFDLNEEAPVRYINLVDIIATMKPEGMEELPTRELILSTSIAGQEHIKAGTIVTLGAELVNFMEDDSYEIKWLYSADGEEFIEIEDAHELTYEYKIKRQNFHYIWRISVVLTVAE